MAADQPTQQTAPAIELNYSQRCILAALHAGRLYIDGKGRTWLRTTDTKAQRRVPVGRTQLDWLTGNRFAERGADSIWHPTELAPPVPERRCPVQVSTVEGAGRG